MKILWTLALAICLTACGDDSGGGTGSGGGAGIGMATDAVVGTWKIDMDDLKPKMMKMARENGPDLASMPEAARATMEKALTTQMGVVLESLGGMQVTVNADGTYVGTLPGEARGLEKKIGTWTRDGDEYSLTEKGDTESATATMEGGVMVVRPPGEEIVFRFVRK